jgi:hypothetical protein
MWSEGGVIRKGQTYGSNHQGLYNAGFLARLRGFEGFVSRKSLKIRTGVQKVFTTKPWVASPEKLRSQVSGGSDSWRRLIG